MTKEQFTVLLWDKISEWSQSDAGPIISMQLGDEIDDFIEEYVQERLLALHRFSAGETLRADLGWQRYDAVNKQLRELESMYTYKQLEK